GKLDKVEAAKLVPELANLGGDRNAEVRARVGDVLKKLGPAGAPAAAAVGRALAVEKVEGGRKHFVEALVAMGPGAKEAVPSIVKIVSDKEQPLRLRTQLIELLPVADPGSKGVAAALVAAAGDPDQTIRLAATDALAHLNPIPDEALAKIVAVAKT